MRYKVQFSPTAKKHITEIHTYIKDELLNSISADRIAKDIVEKSYSLTLFPKASRVRYVRKGVEIRLTFSHNYAIAYSVNEEGRVVTIQAVIYSRRDISNLL